MKEENSCEGSRLDNYKVELHGRFRHLLNSLAALEARLCKVEASLGIEYKPWFLLEGESKPKNMSDSLRTHARNRLTRKLLSQKEKELYDLAFWLYQEKRFGREYLRQLVTIACIDADAKTK